MLPTPFCKIGYPGPIHSKTRRHRAATLGRELRKAKTVYTEHARKSEKTRRALLENEILRDQASLAISEAGDDESAITEAEEAFRAAQQAVIDSRQELLELGDPPRELLRETSIADYFQAAVNDKDLEGAARELNQEMGIGGRWDIPVGLLLEDRATPATTITDEVDVNTRPIAARVFKETDAAWLGVGMQTVAPGTHRFPRLINGTTAAVVAEGDTHDGTAATIGDFEATPYRMTAEYVIGKETLQRVGNNLGPLLEEDLRMVIGEAIDAEIINGDGATPTRPKGILGRISTHVYPNLKTGSTADDTAHTWGDIRGIGFNFLDKRFIRSSDNLRVLFGLETWRYGHEKYFSNMVPEPDAIQSLNNLGVATRPSAAIPAALDKASGVGKRQDAILAAHPENIQFLSWQSLDLLRDPYTGGSAGQTKLVVTLLFSMAYLRSPDNEIRGCQKLQMILEDAN